MPRPTFLSVAARFLAPGRALRRFRMTRLDPPRRTGEQERSAEAFGLLCARERESPTERAPFVAVVNVVVGEDEQLKTTAAKKRKKKNSKTRSLPFLSLLSLLIPKKQPIIAAATTEVTSKVAKYGKVRRSRL